MRSALTQGAAGQLRATCLLTRLGPPGTSASGQSSRAVFFEEGDYALYRDLPAERCRKASVACRGYCLMPNHVHLILVPATADGLARAIGETHRQYTGFVNSRQRWTGHLFQPLQRAFWSSWRRRNTSSGPVRGKLFN